MKPCLFCYVPSTVTPTGTAFPTSSFTIFNVCVIIIIFSHGDQSTASFNHRLFSYINTINWYFFKILFYLVDVTSLVKFRWLITFCMLLIPFPEIIPAFTDQILISKIRFSHFLIDYNRTIWEHSEHFVNNHSSSPRLLVSSCHSSSLLFELLALTTYCSFRYTFL